MTDIARRLSRILAVTAAWAGVAGAAGAVVPSRAHSQAAPVVRARTAAEDLQLFSQVFNQIRVNHPDSLDTHRLFMAAIDAMVRATDPHSYVIPAVRLAPGKDAELRAGKLHPVPLDFQVTGGTAIVTRIAAGTHASRQDILPGDELLEIDGKPVLVESATELDLVLAGPKGSTVALTMERQRADGSMVRISRVVKRERYEDESAVPAALLLDQTTGYVRITTFVGERVAEDLRMAIERLEGAGMQRLVLDLRDNGGGSVTEAAAVAGEFLPTGTVVYTAERRKATAIDTGRVKRSYWKRERVYPIVVMIDGGTASASELVAGALQDHDRAVIVGQPSFGKSLLMQGFPLSDGSVIVLVVGQVRTPCGRAVQRQYRELSSREYYRASVAERDTIGRPTCRSASGRTLYGGGGIYPDVRTPRAPEPPRWVERARELDLPLRWANTYVSDPRTTLGTLDAFSRAPVLPIDALSGFRMLAREAGLDIPTGADADHVLRGLLSGMVAYVKWGNPGVYQVEARSDPAIAAAIAHFP